MKEKICQGEDEVFNGMLGIVNTVEHLLTERAFVDVLFQDKAGKTRASISIFSIHEFPHVFDNFDVQVMMKEQGPITRIELDAQKYCVTMGYMTQGTFAAMSGATLN